MPLQLDANGLTIQNADEIRTEIETEFLTAYGDGIDFSANTPDGQLVGTLTEREAIIQELIQAVYFSQYPDSAEGVSLDNVRSITGQQRLGNEKTKVTLTLGTAGGSPVTIPIGSQARNPTTGIIFNTLIEVEIPALGTIDVDAESVDFGAFDNVIGSITEVFTPISGWDTVTNNADAVQGRLAETDPEFRLSSSSNLTIAQGGTLRAIENYIRNNVDGVTFVGSRSNRTKFVVDSLPPHSINMIVEGGLDQDIFDAIYIANSGGIEMYGLVNGFAVDSLGSNIPVGFSRPVTQDIYLIVNLVVNIDYPVSGDADVKQVLEDWGATNLTNGTDIINKDLVCALDSIAGIEQIDIFQGTSPAPATKTKIIIDDDTKAVITIANITVNS